MPADRPNPPAASEPDDRFPSGPWTGFWLQRGIPGRQWMRNLHLHFLDGRVTGSGSDWIGPFNFTGTYDLATGKASLHKHYLGQYAVHYAGQNDNDGQWLWGLWSLNDGQTGGFHLWPKGEDDPTARRLHAAEELPSEVPEEAAVG